MSFCCIPHLHILIVHHFTCQMILTSPCLWVVHLFLLLSVIFKPSKSRKNPQKSPKIPTNPHLFPCQKSAKPTFLEVHQPPPVTPVVASACRCRSKSAGHSTSGASLASARASSRGVADVRANQYGEYQLLTQRLSHYYPTIIPLLSHYYMPWYQWVNHGE